MLREGQRLYLVYLQCKYGSGATLLRKKFRIGLSIVIPSPKDILPAPEVVAK